ncbi:MAG: hypothetical protein KGI27_11450, partial [Thaumarchaeota archaeon]|nr:hypothetical protein [Nitrososphaerota archaeon]
MSNNILRKVTSLSLLTILLASSAVLALPNAMPAAHAQVASHPNLFVSAENSQYNNYFAGPQVVQVIVADPNINRLDQTYGEPVVTVNGKRLRMAQGTDGNWYGYFADRNQAEIAGNTAPVSGQGLNFGAFCLTGTIDGIDFGSQSKGFTVANQFTGSVGLASSSHSKLTIGPLPASATCTTAAGNSLLNDVVRENKTLNTQGGKGQGSLVGTAPNLEKAWPVIQLFDFSAIPTPVTVDYQAAGGDQIVNLTFDRIPSNLISVTTDRTAYPENTAVFLTMNDPQLNIDPTEEDSWTWGASATNNTLYYEAFDRNGQPKADGTTAMQNLIGNLTSMMFNHNGKFTFSPSAQGVRVVDFQSNGKQILNGTGSPETANTIRGNPAEQKTESISAGSEPITFIEQGGVNTGVFGNWDGGKKPNIVTLSPAEEQTLGTSIRGQSATFKYNDIAGSIVGGFAFGTVTMTATNGTWASGQRIPVTLTDMDQNLNSKITEHINDYDGNRLRIPTMKIGTPFSLNSGCPTCLTGAIDPAALYGHVQLTGTKNSNGTISRGSFSFGTASNATDPDNGIDEQYSNRVVPQFVNGTSPTNNDVALNNGAVVADTGATFSTLLNTIHDARSTSTASTRFHGFNFLNFDLRSFTSLNGATGADPTGVQIFLVYDTNPPFKSPTTSLPSFINPNTGVIDSNAKFISLVNDTNLEDFVNLNGTQPLNGALVNSVTQHDNHGSFYTPGIVDNGTAVMSRIFAAATAAPTADIGFMYQFTTAAGETVLAKTVPTGPATTANLPMVTDFFSIGIVGDGTDNSQRINNAVYRWELEETGDNTGVFTGTNQFVMLNQVNLLDPATYSTLRPINHDVFFAAIQDMLQSEARAPQITYLDLGADGVNTQISAQQDIPTHSGTVSFDQKTYKVGDTVTITVNDQDLNTNNDLVVIYSSVAPPNSGGLVTAGTIDTATDTVGKAGLGFYSDGRSIGRLLDVQFGQQDIRWSNEQIPGVSNTIACFNNTSNQAVFSNTGTPGGFATSLSASGFSLVETAAGSGIFTGTFEVPDHVCQGTSTPAVTNGLNIKVNYVDFRDESGRLIEISDNAGIRGNTGSVKLDKAVYPVPFGTVGQTDGVASFNPAAATTASSINGVFPLHRDLSGSGIEPTKGGTVFALPAGNVIVHARVNDPDYTTAASGTNFINVGVWYSNSTVNNGPVAFQISRQGQSVLLATAGGPSRHNGHILDLGGAALPPVNSTLWAAVPDLGPMAEISPGAGIFQADLPIELTDGPQGSDCPSVNNWDSQISTGTPGFKPDITTRFDQIASGQNVNTAGAKVTGASLTSGNNGYCVRQGDVLTVTYYDTSDASGQPQTVTDSATFDLRNGVLQSDKSVYIIGSDMILTLVEPDFNLDSQTAETLPLDLVEWDSHAYKGTMGPLTDTNGHPGVFEAFDAKPSTFVETGKDTGIFQAVIKIPKELDKTLLERGEQINLEYTDWGPAGSKTVGANSQDIELTIYTSNFGATVELDQKVYTWTDRVYMTVVAPDHNFDPNLIDTIGQTDEDQVVVSTRGHQIFYKLSETGVDTGIFTGYVILTGDPTLKGTGGVDGEGTEPTGIIGDGQPNSCTSVNSACGPT